METKVGCAEERGPDRTTSPQLTAMILAAERLLRLAVLEQAVRDLQLARRIAREASASRFRSDARTFLRRTEAWFEDRADSWPYGFESLCMGIDIDPDALRRQLRIGARFHHVHGSAERRPGPEPVQPLVAGARPA